MSVSNVRHTVSHLVRCYVSGITAPQRAALYLGMITYLSIITTAETQYFSFVADAKNPLNQYFVKYAWGWTFSAVCLLMVLTNYITTGSWVSMRTLQSSCRLAVGTAVWYVFARVLFIYLEEATGECGVPEFVTKRTCYKAGHQWTGFDTSGHCFLLSWNNLFIAEEFQALFQLNITDNEPVAENGTGDKKTNEKTSKQKPVDHTPLYSSLAPYLEYLSCGLAVLMLLGEVMMFCTSLYFHTLLEKLLGTLCGLVSWYVVYRRLYHMYPAWHPGHPLQERSD